MYSTVFIYSAPSANSQTEKGCDCWRPDKKDCRDINKGDPEYLEPDLDDIVQSVMQVMRICRLKAWEVKRTKDAIKRSLRHYEEIRYRIDRVPRKRFNKENFLHDVAVEAGMDRMDAQLAYGIVKRAFHAYFHGTGEGGRRVESFAKQMRHRPECLWLHAARKTAEVFAVYAGLMYSEQMQYEQCIQCVYLSLFNELQSRFKYESSAPRICHCKPQENRVDSIWDAISGTTMMSATTNITTELFFNKHTFNVSNPTSAVSVKLDYTMVSMEQTQTASRSEVPDNKSSNHTIKSDTSTKSKKTEKTEKAEKKKKKPKKKKRRDIKCNCPTLQCTEERPPPVITAESSQGPYICRWIPFEESFPAHRVPCPPMEDICPPCDDDQRPCAHDCTCTCEVCTCPPADEFVEEEHAEKLSGSGLEDRDTDFCWLAPFREGPRVERVLKPDQEEEEIGEDMGEEEELFQCRCTCEVKQRAFPHLFTYLADFKPVKIVAEEEVPVEEPVRPRKPPCGICLETYRCWNGPTKSEEEEDSEPTCRTCPHILAMATANLPPRPTKVKTISKDSTVENQHFPSQGNGSIEDQARATAGGKSSDAAKKSPVKDVQSKLMETAVQKLASKYPAEENTSGKNQANDKDGKPSSSTTPKLPEPKRKTAPAAAAKPPGPAPNNTERPSDDRLTKEDVLKMLGLNK
ncbi:hypothetical protein ACLKA7_013961 [Drosophila subpalustris]